MGAKEQIMGAVTEFANSTIDGYLTTLNNPLVSLLSKEIKTVAGNVISKMEEQVDKVLYYITDKDGNINIGNFDNDAIEKTLADMPLTDFSVSGTLKGKIGNGGIDIYIPQNKFTGFLLGGNNVLSFTAEDIIKLKELMLSAN